MSNRRRSVLVAVGLVLLLSAALPFTVFWSRPCDEEIARARAAWLRYAEAVDGTRAADEARAVLDALDAEDLEAAVERGDDPLAAPPLGNDMAGARYREAVERLALAEGACGR